MKKKILIISGIIIAIVVVAILLFGRSKTSDAGALPPIKVTRGTITEKALAIGTIEPENEISIKSKVEGVVKHIFADAGTFVRSGQPLLEVKPDPTPLELDDAKRQVQLADNDLDNLKKEKVREESLAKKGLISAKELDNFQSQFLGTELKLKVAREHLALLEEGKIKLDDLEIESIVKAPIDGFVLSKAVEVGDPVTPLTSYQEGTVLMKMANMGRLIFKGTVDEIDVGKLKEGMECLLKVGALPNDTVRGTLHRISLKAEKKENATVFPIEILVPTSQNSVLRAGYSANANIIIQRKDNVLMIPERAVTFRNDSAFVKISLGPGKDEEKYVKTGLSDAINIEVIKGLAEHDEILEKPVKKIE
ncbi:MAG TPA: efflux RND transporter periplasmic adaptor subunit [Bacteroidota bacterium]|nr:efflux RND transporter periplasmic adaptor subunit [Bacteroidota bacterium]